MVPVKSDIGTVATFTFSTFSCFCGKKKLLQIAKYKVLPKFNWIYGFMELYDTVMCHWHSDSQMPGVKMKYANGWHQTEKWKMQKHLIWEKWNVSKSKSEVLRLFLPQIFFSIVITTSMTRPHHHSAATKKWKNCLNCPTENIFVIKEKLLSLRKHTLRWFLFHLKW